MQGLTKAFSVLDDHKAGEIMTIITIIYIIFDIIIDTMKTVIVITVTKIIYFKLIMNCRSY